MEKIKLKFNELNKQKIKLIKLIIFKILIILYFISHFNLKKIKIGVISLNHSQNIGNNLLKYAIFIKLSELGFDPSIIALKDINHNISFIQNSIKIRIINQSFSEIKNDDYDILMVNSDQTWRKWDEYFYDIAFLNFAKDWNITKFVYGASLGFDNWTFNQSDEKIAKYLLKDFRGISVREIGSIKYIEEHLGLRPIFVLDPTFLIDKKYYLNLIAGYKSDKVFDDKTIFIYTVTNSSILKEYLKNIKNKHHYTIYLIDINSNNQIIKFIYGIYKCHGVITDSFHGTIFSIIFRKPFISFDYELYGSERFNTLKEVFGLENRIFKYNSNPDINLLETPLKLNDTILKLLKKQSIDYLKKNLFTYK